MRQTSCQQLTLPSSGICTFIMFINMASLCFIRTFDAAFLCGRYTLKDLQKNLEIGWIAVLLQAFFCLYYKYFFTSNVSKTLHVHLQEESQALSYIFSVRYSFFWVHCCKHKGEKKYLEAHLMLEIGLRTQWNCIPFLTIYKQKTQETNTPKLILLDFWKPSILEVLTEVTYFANTWTCFLSWSWKDISK